MPDGGNSSAVFLAFKRFEQNISPVTQHFQATTMANSIRRFCTVLHKLLPRQKAPYLALDSRVGSICKECRVMSKHLPLTRTWDLYQGGDR